MILRHPVLGPRLILVLCCVLGSGPVWAQNGIAEPPPSGPVASGPVIIDDLLWYEFAFAETGVPATGCAPADPDGPGCFPSAGLNSQYADAPPWTFTASGPVELTVVDAYLSGDAFEVFDDGTSIGTTSAPGVGLCGSNPVDCLAEPTASSGTFALGAGTHSITITPTSSPFGGGAAYFRVDAAGPPVPSLPTAAVLALVGLLMATAAWQLYRRRGF